MRAEALIFCPGLLPGRGPPAQARFAPTNTIWAFFLEPWPISNPPLKSRIYGLPRIYLRAGARPIPHMRSFDEFCLTKLKNYVIIKKKAPLGPRVLENLKNF